MKTHAITAAGMLVCSLVALAPVAVRAQQAAAPAAATSLQADLLKDWQGLKDTMVKIADAMPPDKFDFKPKPEVRTYGEQILHVAGANVMILKAIDPSVAAPEIPKTASKAEAIKALSDSFDYGTTLLKAQTNATLVETVNGPAFLGPSTRARLVYRTMGHTWDEYGVMTVYLRLNGLVPPASQR
jgi:hypothetical protein